MPFGEPGVLSRSSDLKLGACSSEPCSRCGSDQCGPTISHKVFGRTDWYGAGGTCGLWQYTSVESSRFAATMGFGRRADRDDTKLGPPIVQGSRLALHLSPRGAEGRRTARFFVDQKEVAVFVDIEDDGGDSDWVAGVTLSDNASVRLVPAEGVELQ